MTATRQLPSMRVRNVQTNNIFKLTDREQIGKCLKQTYNSQVPCERWVDGQKREDHIIRSIPRFEIVTCDEALQDLVPREEATRSLREQLIGKEKANASESMQDLKKFCYEKGIHHSPNMSHERLKTKVDAWKELKGKDDCSTPSNPAVGQHEAKDSPGLEGIKQLTSDRVGSELGELKNYCKEQGIGFSPNISYKKLKERVDNWKNPSPQEE